jgi:RNAse (barnase) inhibitor barstar
LTTFAIDGNRFATLEEFYDEISRVLTQDVSWGRNLDAFDDILRGGFGTPDGGFTLEWRSHDVSRERLGYDETIRQLDSMLSACDSSNRQTIAARLERARAREGETVFDWLVEIIRTHGPGGDEPGDNIQLVLR